MASKMGSNFKAPPAMRVDLPYEDWKKELTIWCQFTDLQKNRQGGALFLTLQGKPREAVLAEVDVDKFNCEDGVDAILVALDNLYLKDKSESSFTAFDNFIKFRRPHGMTIQAYILEFNLRYNKIKCYEMVLPEGVLAYALLTCANLPEDQEQICRATVSKLTYKDMKAQIEKVSLTKESLEKSKYDAIHVEAPFYAENAPEEGAHFEHYDEEYESEYNCEDTYYVRRRPPWRFNPPSQNRPPNPEKARMNPLDEFGNPQTCRFCKSVYHFLDRCPDAPKAGRGAGTWRPSRSRGRGSWRPGGGPKTF